jgi:hypothetical protein
MNNLLGGFLLRRIGFILLLSCFSLFASEWKASLQFQKNYGWLWDNGIGFAWSPESYGGKLRVGMIYVTSSLGSAFNSNNIEEHYYLVDGTWFFRPRTYFNPFSGLELGFYNYNNEQADFDFLPNKSLVCNLKTGFETYIPSLGFSLQTSIGFQIIRKASLMYPLYIRLGVHYDL